MTRLAQIYIMRGQYDLAEPLLQRSLGLRDRLYGQDNPELCDTLRSLAEVYFQTGKVTQAESYIKRVHTIEEKLAASESSASLATTTSENKETAANPTAAVNSGPNSQLPMEIAPVTLETTVKDSAIDSLKQNAKDTDKPANQAKIQLSGVGHQG